MKLVFVYAAVLCVVVADQRAGRASDPCCTPGGLPGACDVRYSGQPDGAILPVGYDAIEFEDDYDRYSSGVERWWQSVCDCVRRRRLRGYKRAQTHHKFLYPQSPAYCSPTFGYHHTQWRPFPPDCEYTWTSSPGQPVWPTPVAEPMLLPLPPTPPITPGTAPQLAPGAETPYFPEQAPVIQPSDLPPPPSEAPDFSPDEAFQPGRSSVDPAAYDFPSIMQIQ